MPYTTPFNINSINDIMGSVTEISTYNNVLGETKAKTPKAAEPINAVIIQPPKLPPLLSPVSPATNAATKGETRNPMVPINEASIGPKEI